MNVHKPSTADRIKEAALNLFLDSGYDGTSLSDIAKAVGIKTPSLYAHFESKAQLFLQLFHDVIAEDLNKFRRLYESMQGEPALQQFRRMFDFYVDNNAQSVGQTFLRQTFLLPPRHLREQLKKDFLQYEQESTELIVSVYRQGLERGVFRLTDEEQMIATLYACSDGLLVERQIYDRELFNSRKEQAWQSLLFLLTTDLTKGQEA
ncbi:TetR/AcrR family transcriptional regulator [Paenibacillus protaetiae]|uniref:TetR/AcrR family transcriptional regulator n=1 Tax=Paenibacillus protaetiae TaxID=2509456 RepID=A0A4P6EXA4_9BACL|nr:TetR/AcrR family transcriptional regulator [Paenibacillus protaetiae]QAY67682.1 TetR/AcrR family transcriptional regulator [Paenibacillus protaetiae]